MVQLRGSPSPPCPAVSWVPAGAAEPQELLCWVMLAAGTAGTIFSFISYPGAIAPLCFHCTRLNPPLSVLPGRARPQGLRFSGYPHVQLGTQGRASQGVPGEGTGSPGCHQPPQSEPAASQKPPARAARAGFADKEPPPSGTGSAWLFQHPQQGHGGCPHSIALGCPVPQWPTEAGNE